MLDEFASARTKRSAVAVVVAAALVGGVLAAGAAVTAQTDGGTGTATEDGGVPTQATAYLGVVHAVPDAPQVDVAIDGRTAFSNVPFGAVSGYRTLAAGDHRLTVTTSANGSVVFDGNLTLDPRSVTTLAVSGPAPGNGTTGTPTVEPVTFDDDAFVPADDESAMRVVNLAPGAPAVDVALADDGTVVAENVSFRNASEYVTLPPGEHTLAIRPATAGGNGTVLATADVALANGTAYSAFVTSGDEAAALEADLSEDAALAVTLPSAGTAPGDAEATDEPVAATEPGAGAGRPTGTAAGPTAGTGAGAPDGGPATPGDGAPGPRTGDGTAPGTAANATETDAFGVETTATDEGATDGNVTPTGTPTGIL